MHGEDAADGFGQPYNRTQRFYFTSQYNHRVYIL